MGLFIWKFVFLVIFELLHYVAQWCNYLSYLNILLLVIFLMILERVCFDQYYNYVCIWEYFFKFRNKTFNEFFLIFNTNYSYRIKTVDLKAVKKFIVKPLTKVIVHLSQLFVILRHNIFYFFDFFINKTYKTYLKHRIFRFFYRFSLIFIDFSFLVFFDFLRFFVFYKMYLKYHQILLGYLLRDVNEREYLLFHYHDVIYRAKLILLRRGFILKNSEGVLLRTNRVNVPFSFFIFSISYDYFLFFFSLCGFLFYTKEFFNRLERFYVRIM